MSISSSKGNVDFGLEDQVSEDEDPQVELSDWKDYGRFKEEVQLLVSR